MRFRGTYKSIDWDSIEVDKKHYLIHKYTKTKFSIFNQLISIYVYQYGFASYGMIDNQLYLTDKGKIYKLFKENNCEEIFNTKVKELLYKYSLRINNNEITIDTNKNVFGHNKQFTTYKKFLRRLMFLLKNNWKE